MMANDLFFMYTKTKETKTNNNNQKKPLSVWVRVKSQNSLSPKPNKNENSTPRLGFCTFVELSNIQGMIMDDSLQEQTNQQSKSNVH